MPVGTLMQPGPSIATFYRSGFVHTGATFLSKTEESANVDYESARFSHKSVRHLDLILCIVGATNCSISPRGVRQNSITGHGNHLLPKLRPVPCHSTDGRWPHSSVEKIVLMAGSRFVVRGSV